MLKLLSTKAQVTKCIQRNEDEERHITNINLNFSRFSVFRFLCRFSRAPEFFNFHGNKFRLLSLNEKFNFDFVNRLTVKTRHVFCLLIINFTLVCCIAVACK